MVTKVIRALARKEAAWRMRAIRAEKTGKVDYVLHCLVEAGRCSAKLEYFRRIVV